jgi:septal ring factor EnvC (AmiA/AmiB activator)
MTSEQKAAKDASLVLRDAARKSGDTRLLALAASLKETPNERLKPVIEAIDKMIANLQTEATEDLEIKQTCETDRMSETRKSILAGREIDDFTDKVVKFESDIKKLEEDIQGLKEEQTKVEEQLKASTRIRDDDHAAFLITDKDDADAAALVKQAKDLLEKFYSENKVLLQKSRAPDVQPGEAPPPPPATWEGGYAVKETESKGIMAMLDLIHADILKDQAAAKSEEDASQKEYDEFKKTSEENLKSLSEQEDEKEKVKGTTIQDKTDAETARGTKKEELDGSLNIIKANNPKCEYYLVNYVLRVNSRQVEIDGLQKAKAILEGASFSSAANLLQSHRN